jgi:hypothetical protein
LIRSAQWRRRDDLFFDGLARITASEALDQGPENRAWFLPVLRRPGAEM